MALRERCSVSRILVFCEGHMKRFLSWEECVSEPLWVSLISPPTDRVPPQTSRLSWQKCV